MAKPALPRRILIRAKPLRKARGILKIPVIRRNVITGATAPSTDRCVPVTAAVSILVRRARRCRPSPGSAPAVIPRINGTTSFPTMTAAAEWPGGAAPVRTIKAIDRWCGRKITTRSRGASVPRARPTPVPPPSSWVLLLTRSRLTGAARPNPPTGVRTLVLALGIAALALPAAAQESAGASVFAGRCAVCHGPEAAGIPGSFPSLHEQIVTFAKTPQGRDYLVKIVTTGLMGELKVGGVTYNGVMPAQSGLSDEEIAAVLGFLASDRGRNGAAPPLAAADVT